MVWWFQTNLLNHWTHVVNKKVVNKKALNIKRKYCCEMVKNQEITSLQANIYLFKVNNRNTRKKVWNVQSYVNDVVLMFLLLTLTIFHTFFSSVSIVQSKQVNVFWAPYPEVSPPYQFTLGFFSKYIIGPVHPR